MTIKQLFLLSYPSLVVFQSLLACKNIILDSIVRICDSILLTITYRRYTHENSTMNEEITSISLRPCAKKIDTNIYFST